MPCATIDTLVIASGLSGDLELDGVIELGDFSMFDNGGLVSLESPSLLRIGVNFDIDRAASLERILLPNLMNATTFAVDNAPRLERITLGKTSRPATVENLSVTNTAATRLDLNLDSVDVLVILNNPNLNGFYSMVRHISQGIFEFNGDNLNVDLRKLVSAFTLSFSHTTAILLWSLVYVNSTFTITNNSFLPFEGGPYSLHVPLLETVGFGLSLVNNTGLVDVKFPRLQTVGDFLSIENNSAVVRLDFPHLHKINGNFTVADNPAIAELGGFPELTEVSEKAVLKGDFV